MIETTTVSGRPAQVAYIGSDGDPVARDQAALIKVLFTDSEGGIAFLVGQPQDKAKTMSPATPFLFQSAKNAALAKLTTAQRFAIARAKAESTLARLAFDESQHPRDDHGRWTDGGGSDTGAAKPASEPDIKPEHKEQAAKIVAEFPGAKERIAAAKERLAKSVRNDALVSEGGHKTADGNWTRERQGLHEQILKKIFTPEAIAAATPKPGEQPVVHLLGGSGGSGKSWFTSKDGTIDKSKNLYINSDDIKEALPEYQGWNAALVHEESSQLGKTAEAAARKHGLNMILDGTMANPKALEQRIDQYKKAGYRVEGHFMRVKPETSARRAIGRYMRGGETGRLVAPEMILALNSTQNFAGVRARMDASELYDNEGKAPVLIDRQRTR